MIYLCTKPTCSVNLNFIYDSDKNCCRYVSYLEILNVLNDCSDNKTYDIVHSKCEGLYLKYKALGVSIIDICDIENSWGRVRVSFELKDNNIVLGFYKTVIYTREDCECDLDNHKISCIYGENYFYWNTDTFCHMSSGIFDYISVVPYEVFYFILNKDIVCLSSIFSNTKVKVMGIVMPTVTLLNKYSEIKWLI